MDARITLSFNEAVINKAKKYAQANNISLSRLVELLLQKVVTSGYESLEDYPIAEWVTQVSKGEATYQTKKNRSRKSSKNEFLLATRL